MTPNKGRSWVERIGWRLLLVAMLTLPTPLLVAPSGAQAAPAQSAGGPIIGLFAAWIARNRVYRTANAYIDRQHEYYGRLHAKAQEQLRSRSLGGLRTSQVAAYVKVVVLIERERRAMIQFAESEKLAARTKFGERVNNTVVNVMLSTTPATRVLGAMKDALGSSKGMINHALDKLAGEGSGALAEVHRVRDTASWVSVAGEIIGGKAGRQIRTAANGVVDALDGPMTDVQKGLEEVSAHLDDVDEIVTDLQGRGYLPSAGEVAREALISVVTGEQPDPAAEAVVDVLAKKTGQGGGFRDRARAALAGNVVARCSAIGARYRQILQVSIVQEELPEDVVQNLIQPPSCKVIDLDALAGEDGEERPAETQVAQATPEDKEPAGDAPTAQAPPTAMPSPTVTPSPTVAPSPTVTPSPTAGTALQDLDPCDLMPPGGVQTSDDERTCVHQYATEWRVRAIQINRMFRPAGPDDPFCQSMEKTYDNQTTLAKWPLGVCGFVFDVHYEGKKIPGYTGWHIAFVLDHFHVRVFTKEEYPANKDWVESTAAQIEADIRSRAGLSGD